MSATPPTLGDFTDWLNELHGANFDALDAKATDGAYRAHFDSFTRTNATLNLLAQFKAAHSTSPSADSEASDSPSMLVKMTEQRQMACMEATWEIDAIARALPGLVPDHSEEDGLDPHLLVRAMAGRLLRLTHVLMSALGDSVVQTERLEAVIRLGRGQG